MREINNSYKTRRRTYWAYMKNPNNYLSNGFSEDTLRATESDLCLTFDDVAEILGFTKEHVLNYIKDSLVVIPVAGSEEFKREMRAKVGSNRVKCIISKESVERFVAKDMSFVGRRTTISIEKNSQFIADIKAILGKGGKIQALLDDAGGHLNRVYRAEQGAREFYKKKQKIKDMLGSPDKKMLVKVGALDMEEVEDYLKREATGTDERLAKDFTDILAFDMYSVKTLKEKFGFKHTKQVYRFLEKTSYVAIKLGDSEYNPMDKKASDRNIRYIITEENLKIEKGQYRLSMDHFAYSHVAERWDNDEDKTKEAIFKAVLAFAEENKEKYKKEDKEKK